MHVGFQLLNLNDHVCCSKWSDFSQYLMFPRPLMVADKVAAAPLWCSRLSVSQLISIHQSPASSDRHLSILLFRFCDLHKVPQSPRYYQANGVRARLQEFIYDILNNNLNKMPHLSHSRLQEGVMLQKRCCRLYLNRNIKRLWFRSICQSAGGRVFDAFSTTNCPVLSEVLYFTLKALSFHTDPS